jgi:hypothetical protein
MAMIRTVGAAFSCTWERTRNPSTAGLLHCWCRGRGAPGAPSPAPHPQKRRFAHTGKDCAAVNILRWISAVGPTIRPWAESQEKFNLSAREVERPLQVMLSHYLICNKLNFSIADHPLGTVRLDWRTGSCPNLPPRQGDSESSHSRFNQLLAFPERCPRMTCSTNSSPNRLVNGPEPNKKR